MTTPWELARELAQTQSPIPVTTLRNAHLPGLPGQPARLVDVLIKGDTVAEVEPAGALGAGPGSVDLSGYLLLPAAAEPHAHLDKAGSIQGLAPAYGDLNHAIEQWQSLAAGLDTTDFYHRARSVALQLLSAGVTAIRTHCDLLLGDDPLRGLRALLAVRDELRPVLDIEVCVLPSWLTPRAVIEQAMLAGADLMGGCPHIAPDPRAELDSLLGMARQFGTGLDIHADEQLTAEMLTVLWLAREVKQRPLDGTVTAGHCVSLATLPAEAVAQLAAEVAAAGVGVVALPITNLFLQGRQHPTLTPRGLTAIQALLDAGVTLAAGGDNIRDPFNPVGRGDPLETASLLVTAGHLSLEQAYTAVSSSARTVMGLATAGVVAGARAELLACRGSELSEVIATAPEDRVVIHNGRVVSVTVTSRSIAIGAGIGPPAGNLVPQCGFPRFPL